MRSDQRPQPSPPSKGKGSPTKSGRAPAKAPKAPASVHVPHTSFKIGDILSKAATYQETPITDKAELRLHAELTRAPCHLITHYSQREKLTAKGARWNKELKTWTTTNPDIVRENRDVIIFVDGFVPPRHAMHLF